MYSRQVSTFIYIDSDVPTLFSSRFFTKTGVVIVVLLLHTFLVCLLRDSNRAFLPLFQKSDSSSPFIVRVPIIAKFIPVLSMNSKDNNPAKPENLSSSHLAMPPVKKSSILAEQSSSSSSETPVKDGCNTSRKLPDNQHDIYTSG